MKKEQKTNSLTFFSPAKLNLFFRVLSKRDDGFHEIASLMQAISLGDTLTFEVSSEDQLESTDPTLACDHSNLIFKALVLFRQKTGIAFPVKIHLQKRIPTQAGLGGGSSNCSTTLWALNELSGKPATAKELQTWSAEISSDAPFFFSTGIAYATGRGEKIKNLRPFLKQKLWLAKPRFGLTTPHVYRHCKPNAHICPKNLLKTKTFMNDLEEAVFSLEPPMEKLKNDLLALGFQSVIMTGSGSTFFCLGEIEQPHLPDIEFIQTTPLSRNVSKWYRDK